MKYKTIYLEVQDERRAIKPATGSAIGKGTAVAYDADADSVSASRESKRSLCRE